MLLTRNFPADPRLGARLALVRSTMKVAAVVAWLLLDAALACAGVMAEADQRRATQRDVSEVTQGLLTISVEGSPLDHVLEMIALRSGVSIRGRVPAGETVTADLRDLPVDEALTRLLGVGS